MNMDRPDAASKVLILQSWSNKTSTNVYNKPNTRLESFKLFIQDVGNDSSHYPLIKITEQKQQLTRDGSQA